MTIVPDTNIFLAVALGEPERAAIVAATKAAELVAPEILPYEIGNALSSLFKRGLLSASQLQAVWSATRMIPVDYRPVDVGRALHLAAQHKIYAYDAYFLECALRLRAPLLTLDKKLCEVAAAMRVELVTLGAT